MNKSNPTAQLAKKNGVEIIKKKPDIDTDTVS